MKKIVISLLRRTDRKREFTKNPIQDYEFLEAHDGSQEIYRQCRARQNWIDPFRNRPLQQNEVACFLSHMKAWQRVIDLGEPCIVMEDDAIVKADQWNEGLYKRLSKTLDFVYLQHNENEPERSESVSEVLCKPYYPYNMTAYVLTPLGAQFLLDLVDLKDMIPVDEFLPEVIRDHPQFRLAALKEDACNQLPREMGDIENGTPFRHYKIHSVSCGTDRKKMSRLCSSARMHGIDVHNIGENVQWRGTDMTGLGGGMKINLMREYLEDMNDEDVVVFTDGYDVFYADNLETILERFEQFGHDVVFSAESICWPHKDWAVKFPPADTKYRYLNSGTYVGKVAALKKIMSHDIIEDHEDDQAYCQEIYLGGFYDIVLDHECYIFQTHEPKISKLGSQLWNQETRCCPCIYHGNGGQDAAEALERLHGSFYPQPRSLFIPHNKVEQIHRDMLLVDFMTQDQCERLIEIADEHGGWGSLEYDKFPAQEIRMRALDLWEDLDHAWKTHIVPAVEKYWTPLQMYGLRDGFVMRYAMDTQTSLNLHHDASLVTGSVKLNNDYEGADLIFPRQGISNRDIPVGKMILFPSAVTHGHECLPLQSGVKYSLTIWSRRYLGDNI